jgi:predicted O-methyltransferase YrrM
MVKLPQRFTHVPEVLRCCNPPATQQEIEAADKVRREYVLPEQPPPYMHDVVRAFRVAKGAKVYIEVGTQDKGNIAWAARTKLAKGATIIDIDLLDYPQADAMLKAEMQRSGFDYHAVRGDCLSDGVLDQVRAILNGRCADAIFCDSHYTYSHTLTEFTLYQPLVRPGGVLMFHDAQWPGDPAQAGEFGLKGKGIAIIELDRFYPAWMVTAHDTPLFRPIPTVSWGGHWGTLAMFPC